MKRWLKRGLLFLIIVFVGIQFIPVQRNTGERNVETDFLKIYNPPENISRTLSLSCYNCHSNHTEYPWYAYIQPVASILQNHIDSGKAVLNYSEFDDYSGRRKRMKLKSMIDQIEENKMPLPEYLFMHPEAKLNEDEKKAIIAYLVELKEKYE